MKTKIEFFIKENKIHFQIPGNLELERRVRATIKNQTAREKDAYFFKRGVADALESIQNGTERKYGPKKYRVVLDTGTDDGLWTRSKIVDYLHTGGAWVDNSTETLCADIYIYEGNRKCEITEFVNKADFYSEQEWAQIIKNESR